MKEECDEMDFQLKDPVLCKIHKALKENAESNNVKSSKD